MKPGSRRRLLAALAFAFAVAGTPHAPGAAETAPPPSVVMTDPEAALQESEVLKTLRQALEQAIASRKGFGLYKQLKPEVIPIREAALLALRQNLSIQQQGLAREIAEEAVVEADAVFDPVFSVSLSGSRTRTQTRVEEAYRFKGGTVADGGNLVVNFSEGPIQQLIYDGARTEGFFRDVVTANEASKTGSKKTATLDLILEQQLPWGQSFSVDLTIHREPKFFTNNAGSEELETHGNYDRPWISTLTSSISTPAPFTKGFGPDSPNAIADEISRISLQVARRTLQVVINDILTEVDSAYWDLVSAAQVLYVSIQTQAVVEDLLTRTRRLYRAQSIIRSDKSQVESLAASVRGDVEQAFLDYVSASNALWRLLGGKDPVLLMPAGYAALFSRTSYVPEDPGLIFGNPEYLDAVLDVRSADANLRGAENQALPDIYLSATATLAQSNAVFGYDDVGKSLENVANPDSITLAFSASFIRALGNRAAEATADSASHFATQRRLELRKVRRELENEFEDALISLKSARESVGITQRNLELARSVYERSLRLQKNREVTEYQISENVRTLLSRKRSFISALVSAKKAEATALAAAGLLAEHYGERTAQTVADVVRLRALAGTGELKHFGGSK